MSTPQRAAQPTGTPAKKTARPTANSKSRRRVPGKTATPKEPRTVRLIAGDLQSGESNVAAQACNDYVLMGAGRSLMRLQRLYVTWGPNEPKNRPTPVDLDRNRPDLGTSGAPPGRSVEIPDDATEEAIFACIGDVPSVAQLYPRAAPPPVRQMPPIEETLFTHALQLERPTRSLSTLKAWSGKYEWARRAEHYDAARSLARVAEHRQVMDEGIALPYNRVQVLKEFVELLIGQALAQDEQGNYVHLWLRDVKSVGAGEFCQTVTVTRYNKAIIKDIRGLLADVARKGGGRQSNLESLVRDIPWDRMPDRFAYRMLSEHPRDVIMDMFETIVQRGIDDDPTTVTDN